MNTLMGKHRVDLTKEEGESHLYFATWLWEFQKSLQGQALYIRYAIVKVMF